MTQSKTPMQHFTLSNGNKIPAIAFGSGSKWRLAKLARGEDSSVLSEELINAVKDALDAGFTHLDTAEIYETHGEIAEGIKRSGIDRSNLCITTKYLPGYRGKRAISVTGPYEAIQTALKQLQTDYIDNYFIHNPFFRLDWTYGITMEEAWSQIERAYDEGLVKNIGISNFNVSEYQQLLDSCKVKPQLLQVEFHPYCYNQRPGIIKFAQLNGAQVESYGTLTPFLKVKEDGPLDAVLKSLCSKYDRSQAQILLRWAYQNDVLPVTTSGNPERLAEAVDIFKFELTPEDVKWMTDVGATYPYREYFQEEWGKHSVV